MRRERLISLLTQVVARELSALPEPGAPRGNYNQEPALPPPIKVFISHAKADGVREAEALRSAILNRGQLQAFYDESDLPIGYSSPGIRTGQDEFRQSRSQNLLPRPGAR